ncbi:uncharacterized protein BJ171DRAFT_247947 [Polychytrium aggregatum]|uniref:uncharacterized protein n=1 Tax=Polychytrium aggregatum TaxID=110093 RepID=UPI0022FDE2BE|nr:uncharacterized protein BJ171DRAFT_247947 [Polychytrium aggregatum]KAI9193667.1 hypothetical protein BJ171DRAFT_247947 [Polychytrium aggregatum]
MESLKLWWNSLPYLHPEVLPPSTPFTAPGASSSPLPILYVYPAQKHHITSIDVECVRIQAFLSFYGFNHAVRETCNPEMSPSGQLPFLVTLDNRVLAGRQIVDEVAKNFPELHVKPDLDTMAFSSLADSRLKLALTHSLWYDIKIAEKLLHCRFSQLAWPLGPVVLRIKRSEELAWMLNRKPVLYRDEIYREAEQALSALSVKLGQHSYFGGVRPSYLDATVFAYLHIILSLLAGSDETELRKLVLRHENLVQYAKRIWSTWFATTPKRNETSGDA